MSPTYSILKNYNACILIYETATVVVIFVDY